MKSRGVPSGDVEGLNDARTLLADFFSILLEKDGGVFRPNVILRMVIGLSVWGVILSGTALAGSRVIPVAGGG